MGDCRQSDESLDIAAVLREFGGLIEGRERFAPAADLPCQWSPAPRSAPTDAPERDTLARIVEAEILPRLMLAHRDPPPPVRLPVAHRPMPEQVARFCTLLLAPDDGDVTPHVLALLDDGLSLDGLMLDLLAPSARHLGALWEEDECDFVDVTLALGRLQAVARQMCARLETGGPAAGALRVLLVPGPGETHLFGLSLVASFFREAGWDTTIATSEQSLGLARAEWFDVIGLSLSCDVYVGACADAVRVLRGLSRNRAVRVMAGGPIFERDPDALRRVGADATAPDGLHAPAIAESLLEMRARAC